MKKQIISFRERIAIQFTHGDKPYAPKVPSVTELYPEQKKPEESVEKAPIAEHGVGGAAWAKLGPNLDVKYEVPSFGRGSDISVLVSGKMPYTTGHHVQFTGVLDSAGIGDIFTMDHDLVSSIRKFVYQELPSVDKFDRKILDEIYSDVMTDVGLNVPIRSIYQYLRNNYPKEFSKATGGRNVTPEQMSTLLQKQKSFYNKGRISSRTISKTAAYGGDFSENSLVTIDFSKLDERQQKTLREYDKGIGGQTPLVYLKPKDDLHSVVVIKTDKGVLKPISLPTKFIREFKSSGNWAAQIKKQNEEVYGYDYGDKDKDASDSELFAKLGSKKVLNAGEIIEVFKQGMLGDLNRNDFKKILSLGSGKKLFAFYEKNKDKIDSKTKAKFILYKVTEVDGEGKLAFPLSDDEINLALKTFDEKTINAVPELALASIHYKINQKIHLEPLEIDFLIKHEEFDPQKFAIHPNAFIGYYEAALGAGRLGAIDPQVKAAVMSWKKEQAAAAADGGEQLSEEQVKKTTFTEEEKNDPVYRAKFGTTEGSTPQAQTQGATPQQPQTNVAI